MFRGFKLLILIVVGLVLCFNTQALFAQESPKFSFQNFAKDTIRNSFREDPVQSLPTYTKEALSDSSLYGTLANIKTPPQPFPYGEYFIFIYKKDSSSLTDRIYIAFEHELYARVHNFITIQSNPEISVYILPRLHEDQEINYRLIINSMWTVDPFNDNSKIDSRGVLVSSVMIPKLDPLYLPSVVKIDANRFRIYLYMKQGYSILKNTDLSLVDMYRNDIQGIDKIFLVGSFTNWDPYLIEMNKSPNVEDLYYYDLELSAGIYYYYFNAGVESLLDPHNESIARRNKMGNYVNTFRINEVVEELSGSRNLVVSTMDN